jgi:hypothetical protein
LNSSWPDGPPGPSDTPTAAAEPLAPGAQRFQSCRWRRPPEDGQPECCGHRDVLPMAGTTSFNPEAWCVDCGYYKAKRTPRKPADRDRY